MVGHAGIMLDRFSSNLLCFIGPREPGWKAWAGDRLGARVINRRAIKSLRRKGSLLYEPRRRTRGEAVNLGAG